MELIGDPGELSMKKLMENLYNIIDDINSLFPIKANISFQYLLNNSNKIRRYFEINVIILAL